MRDAIARHGHGHSPFFSILIGAPVPLAIGAMLSDWAYSGNYQIQWINFADWLVAGSLVFAGLALLWSIVANTARRHWRSRTSLLTSVALALFFAVQFFNALVHSKDAYATMPAGLVLSVIAAILSVIAAWIGFTAGRVGDAR